MSENSTQESMISKASGLKAKDYIAYALGDVGGCLVFSLVTTILQVWYTDVFKLNPFFIMIMFVIARIWDGINDPIMGRICDTVKVSRWGRYRPWFLYGCIPLALSAVLMFIKWPGISIGGRGMAIYATVTYIFFGMCYTMIQIPYGSLASVVTLDEKERSKLSVFRSVGATIGNFPVMAISAMYIKSKFMTDETTGEYILDEAGKRIKIGQYVDEKVVIVGSIIIAVGCIIMFLLAFAGNKERVVSHPVKPQKGDTWKAVKRLATNKSMLSLSIISMLLLAGQMFILSYYTYLIKQYFNRGGIWIMLPTVLTYLPMAILMFFTPKLVRKFGKQEITGFGMALAAVANLAMFFLKFMNPETAIYPFMGLCFISGIGLNFLVLQVWAMVSDCIDDIEVKTGSRDNGTAFSFFMFFRKRGQVIAAVAVNSSLIAMGYFEGVKQSSDVFTFSNEQLSTMYALATIIPAVMFGLMAIFLFAWYPLSKKHVAELQILKEEQLKEAIANNKVKLN